MNSLQMAINASSPDNYISISRNPYFSSDGDDPFTLEIEEELARNKQFCDPEEWVYQKDLEEKKKRMLESLSQEAREIISIIVDCPKDLKEVCLGGDLDKVSLLKLKCLMRKQWGSRSIVKELFIEVHKFAKKIKEMNDNDGEIQDVRRKKRNESCLKEITYAFK